MWRRWLYYGLLSALDRSLDLCCSSLLMGHSLLRWWRNTQMLLYLPKDGSMLGLPDNKLILMCTYDCYLLGENTLSDTQCVQCMT